MQESYLQQDVQSVLKLINTLPDQNIRRIIAIAGPPGAGKSTLADAVVSAINSGSNNDPPLAVLVPMDGYHLDNEVLQERGLVSRKGAPHTFDVQSFSRDLQQLAVAGEEMFFPGFDRQRDMTIADAIVVDENTGTVVVEGNYLLLNSQPWSELRQLFACTVLIRPLLATLESRLLRRWLDLGLDPVSARQKVDRNDLPNARLVLTQSQAADLILGEKTETS